MAHETPFDSTESTALSPDRRPDEQLVPLNLVTTYPVQWTQFQVLRDFVQNFFDSVPNESFAKRVSLRCSGSVAELTAEDVVFSHEWLVPMGASTKTGADDQFAGYFGEGFKVAALCATRDYGWRVFAGSRDWQLRVTTSPLRIDGADLETLAYRVRSHNGASSGSWLRIEGLSPEDAELLETAVLWSFYYPENPLLGELVWADARTALWKRSLRSLPRDYPGSHFEHGILFIGRQARGTHELPFALAAHDRHDRDRERTSYYDFQVIDAIADIAKRLPASASAALLEAASRHWCDYRERQFEPGTWEPVVCRLAANIAGDPAVARQWRERHPHLLVVEPLPRGSKRARNERAEARAWARASVEDWRFVQKGFRALEYPSLEEACRAHGGFLRPVAPQPEDLRRIALLRRFVLGHLGDLFPLAELPSIEVVDATRAGWGGRAEVFPRRRGPLSASGRRGRYDLGSVAVASSALRSPSPERALATLLHELCHAFGTDGSASFGAALTDVLERLASKPEALAKLAAGWSRAEDER